MHSDVNKQTNRKSSILRVRKICYRFRMSRLHCNLLAPLSAAICFMTTAMTVMLFVAHAHVAGWHVNVKLALPCLVCTSCSTYSDHVFCYNAIHCWLPYRQLQLAINCICLCREVDDSIESMSFSVNRRKIVILSIVCSLPVI